MWLQADNIKFPKLICFGTNPFGPVHVSSIEFEGKNLSLLLLLHKTMAPNHLTVLPKFSE